MCEKLFYPRFSQALTQLHSPCILRSQHEAQDRPQTVQILIRRNNLIFIWFLKQVIIILLLIAVQHTFLTDRLLFRCNTFFFLSFFLSCLLSLLSIPSSFFTFLLSLSFCLFSFSLSFFLVRPFLISN